MFANLINLNYFRDVKNLCLILNKIWILKKTIFCKKNAHIYRTYFFRVYHEYKIAKWQQVFSFVVQQKRLFTFFYVNKKICELQKNAVSESGLPSAIECICYADLEYSIRIINSLSNELIHILNFASWKKSTPSVSPTIQLMLLLPLYFTAFVHSYMKLRYFYNYHWDLWFALPRFNRNFIGKLK